MNIVLCDDDKLFLCELKYIINIYLDTKHIPANFYMFTSGDQFLNWYESKSKESILLIDFLFIDMEMPKINGLETLKIFRKYDKKCIVYIISNYFEFILDSFEFKTFQFILKPLDKKKFIDLFDRGLREHFEKEKKIIINSENKHIALSNADIIMIETFGRSTIIHTTSGVYKTSTKISEFEKSLSNYSFLRCHKSYLINMEKVIYYQGYQFFLVNGCLADISYRKRAELVKKFDNYILKQEI